MSAGTVVVSGAAGFIGTRVVPRLLDAGYEVIALDNLHPQVHPELRWPDETDPRAHRVDGSVEDIAVWRTALQQAGTAPTVLHLAAETGTGQSLTEARRHASVNVVGTAALTDALVELSITPRSIVLTSSRAVYGEGSWSTADGAVGSPSPRVAPDLERHEWSPRIDGVVAATPLPNEAAVVPARPTNVYASTKLAQEHLLTSWCSAMGVPLSVLRLQNVYGAGQSLSNSYTGVLTFFATRAAAGQAIEVYEGGGILRDFVHVSDVAAAIHAAIDRPGAVHGAVDIGSGASVTLLEVANTMARLADSPTPVVTDRYRPGDVRAAFASIEAAREALGYEPATGLAEGLRGLLDYAAR